MTENYVGDKLHYKHALTNETNRGCGAKGRLQPGDAVKVIEPKNRGYGDRPSVTLPCPTEGCDGVLEATQWSFLQDGYANQWPGGNKVITGQ